MPKLALEVVKNLREFEHAALRSSHGPTVPSTTQKSRYRWGFERASKVYLLRDLGITRRAQFPVTVRIAVDDDRLARIGRALVHRNGVVLKLVIGPLFPVAHGRAAGSTSKNDNEVLRIRLECLPRYLLDR